MFRDYSKLVTLYKIGELHFRLPGTNGFHTKAKNKRFTATGSRCRQNLKYENFTSSFGRLRQKIVPKRVPHVQHDYFSSLNQSNHLFVALSSPLPSSFLNLTPYFRGFAARLDRKTRQLRSLALIKPLQQSRKQSSLILVFQSFIPISHTKITKVIKSTAPYLKPESPNFPSYYPISLLTFALFLFFAFHFHCRPRFV